LSNLLDALFLLKERLESGCLCEDLGFRLRIAGKILGQNGNYAIVHHFLYAEDMLFSCWCLAGSSFNLLV
jgi:hypothetical protein